MSAKTERLLGFYREHLELQYSERTTPQYLARVKAFLEWTLERGIELTEIRTSDLQSYQSELLAKRKDDDTPYSLGFHQNQLVAIKNLFRFLFENGYLLHDPARTVEFRRKEIRLPRVVLTHREAQRVIEAAKGEDARKLRDRAILETLYATGIRASELANLELSDVDTREKTLRVVLGKGRKDRYVPLTTAAAEALEAYLLEGRSRLLGAEKHPYLFLADKAGWIHNAVLNKLLRRYAKRAGVRKHVTCHTFRHSVATHLLKGRADIRHIQMLLGHASLQTTQRYTRVEISDLREVIARAHPRA
jgi:integrase/recombinase XerD